MEVPGADREAGTDAPEPPGRTSPASTSIPGRNWGRQITPALHHLVCGHLLRQP